MGRGPAQALTRRRSEGLPGERRRKNVPPIALGPNADSRPRWNNGTKMTVARATQSN
jgi:hypothetical protein